MASDNSLDAVIRKCECSNTGQDKLHGKGMRVHNPFKMKDGKTLNYRCTVCSKERS
jgi:hypothetical protein